jgi:hypothetical protein
MFPKGLAERVLRHGAAVLVGVYSRVAKSKAEHIVFVVLGLAFFFAYTSAQIILPKPDGRILTGDSVYYYVYLRSMLHDFDLRFANDFEGIWGYFNPPRAGSFPVTRTGYVSNPMSIGPALMWAPAHVVLMFCLYLAQLFGLHYPVDGFGRLFQAAVGWSGILAATLGAYFSYRLCARRYSPRVTLAATITVWLSSSAVYYTAISPTYSHACSMLAVSGFFAFWAARIGDMSVRRFVVVGALGGVCALVRFQDAVLLSAPLLELALHANEERSARGLWTAMGRAAICVSSAFLAFSPQLVAWVLIYGRPFLVPQGSSFMRWNAPYLWAILFSDWRGLFTVTPILALSTFGLVYLRRDSPTLAPGVAVALVLSVYVNASIAQWWAGESFGARRFVSCFPLFVLGTAAVFSRMKPRMVVAVASVFIVLNGLLLLQYQLFMHGLRTVAPYPRGFYGLAVARFVVPFKLLGLVARVLWH